MVGPDGEESHQFLYNRWLFIASVLGPRGWSSATLAAWASYYQYCLCKVAHRRARFRGYSKNAGAVAERRFRRWGPGAGARGPKTWCWDLKLTRLLVRTVNNEGFESFQLKGWLLLNHLVEENEIERLQLCLLCLNNNLFENGSEKALEPSGPGKNSGSLYPWIVKGYYGQWE